MPKRYSGCGTYLVGVLSALKVIVTRILQLPTLLLPSPTSGLNDISDPAELMTLNVDEQIMEFTEIYSLVIHFVLFDQLTDDYFSSHNVYILPPLPTN